MFVVDDTGVRTAYKVLVKGGMRTVAIETSAERVKHSC
jgi:hypothetical protein